MSNQKFGHIRKTKNNTYRAFWRDYGIQHSKTFKSLVAAELHLLRIQQRHGYVDYGIIYLNYYELIKQSIYENLSKRTKADHENYWNKLKPKIGQIKVSDTDWWLVQDTINSFECAEAQRKIYYLLKKLLDYALRDELIFRNPCDKLIKIKRPTKKNKILWAKDELEQILNYINGTKFALPVLLESICGLRHEEYCGLNRSDIAYKKYNSNIEININKAVTAVNGHKIIKETKNKYSDRIVMLDKHFFSILLQINLH